MNKHIFLFFSFLIVSCLVFCTCSKNLPKKTLTITVQLQEGQKECHIEAQIARTEEQRAKGYMFCKHIQEGTGMLFVYDYDTIMHFWMKNTPSPLSIAFIDSSGKIRDIFDMTPFSLQDVASTNYCRYALEVPQGYFQKVGITEGSKLHLDF